MKAENFEERDVTAEPALERNSPEKSGMTNLRPSTYY